MNFKFMRIILFFDLPTMTKKDLKNYRHFVKYLNDDGFVMYQESVYTKLCLTPSIVDQTKKKLKENVPPDGFISVLTITETQFSTIENIIGEVKADVIMSSDKIVKL